ncbi:MAG: hypothetical protein PVJ84_21790, partial [Desulfobacteraceae bacterium]
MIGIAPPFRHTARGRIWTQKTNAQPELFCLHKSQPQFKKTDPYHHYICSISVASAGTFINPQQYQKEYNRLQNDHKRASPDRWQQRLLLDFPDIGSRAQWGHISAGPGGASFQLMFTTSDGRYDIKALISNLLPENVESPDL